jgi:sulfite reductase alpha subunit-like flavoprotein
MSDCPLSEDEPLLLLESSNGRVWHEAEDFPKALLYNDLLTYFVDLSRLPTQEVLQLFLKHADKPDAGKLGVLVDDQDEYDKWAARGNTLIDTLREFPSVHLPSAELLGRLPAIQSRLYSIASTPSLGGGVASLVVGVARIQTAGDDRQGLCSGQLQRAALGSSLPAFFRTAAGFKLPTDASKPVVMVAAGSGIAPFRGFWQQRERQARAGVALGPTVLLFGCRTRAMDLLSNETEKYKRWLLSVTYSRLNSGTARRAGWAPGE